MRLVPGITHTNVIFEAAIPPELFQRRDEIGEALQSVVKEINESYVPVMQIEHSYDGELDLCSRIVNALSLYSFIILLFLCNNPVAGN